MMRHLLVLLLTLIFNDFGFAQKTKLDLEIENLKKDNSLKHGTWSICVMNTQTNAIVTEYNSHLSVIPASTLKIVTTAAALSILGTEFTFETQLLYDGVIDSHLGVLKGNLYIKGGGDPSLGSEYFRGKKDSVDVLEKWANIIKSKGIKKIDGAIIADASIFEDNMIPDQWIWGDIGNYFGAGACGLSYHDNKYAVDLKSGIVGSNTTINKINPPVKDLQFINAIKAGGRGDSAFIFGAPYTNYRFASGTIPANKNHYEIEGSIPDPALFCAQAFEMALKNKGVVITEKATTIRALKENKEYAFANTRILYSHRSPSLDKIVYWTNFKSLNLYAEHLLKYISYTKTRMGTETKGIDAIIDFWKSKGIDVSGLYMTDGSGLARANTITTRTQTQILRYMSKDKTFTAFYNSLPVAGKSGSLGGLCEGTCAENNLRAKSGYINRARGYCGYVKNKKGDMLCFSVLANNYECSPTEMKLKLEKLLVAIAEEK